MTAPTVPLVQGDNEDIIPACLIREITCLLRGTSLLDIAISFLSAVGATMLIMCGIATLRGYGGFVLCLVETLGDIARGRHLVIHHTRIDDIYDDEDDE